VKAGTPAPETGPQFFLDVYPPVIYIITMKSKPSNTVNILGIPYEVKRVPFIDRNSYRAGEINFETQEIRLLDSLKEGAAGTTLFHELVHGILMGLKFIEESDNEKLVQGLAVGLYQALNDNPNFFNLYKGGI